MDVTIIGLGGVGSVIALRMGLHHRLNLIDFDTYETRNSFRQPLAYLMEGENKAKAHKLHLEQLCDGDVAIEAIQKKITMEEQTPLCDLIIAAVDNNAARNCARHWAIKTKTPLIIAANETEDAEASILFPEWEKTPLDPWITWPELWDESTPETKPLSCTDPKIAEVAEQTPNANFMAAAGAIWLAEAFAARKFQYDEFTPIRFAMTRTMIRTKRPNDLLTPEQWHSLPISDFRQHSP